MKSKKLLTYARYAWFVLLFNLFVIVWGGFVSASGSGDGCGTSWPLCPALTTENSSVTKLETMIEFVHRLTSGLALLLVIGLAIWARRKWKQPHPVRQAAIWSLFFIFIEALLGAGLVIFKWVDTNESLARAFVQPIHLANTFLLTAALLLTAWWSNELPIGRNFSKPFGKFLLIGLVGVLFLSMFGTIASLASKIFPSESFFAGLQKDFARDAHYLIRLRIWHPLIATFLFIYLIYLYRTLSRQYDSPLIENLSLAATVIFGGQFALGTLNAVLLAPVWIQLGHLLLAHVLWLCLVCLTTTVLANAPATEKVGFNQIARQH